MDGRPVIFRRRRVRASWAILGLAALSKAAFIGWLGWLSLSLVMVSQALAGMAHMPPPPPRPLGQVLVGAAELAGLLGIFAGAVGAGVAALQRLALGHPSPPEVFQDPLPRWAVRSGAAAAVAAAGWLFVVAVWNNLDGMPGVAGALTELIVGSTAEVWAVVAVQRRLLARARFRVPDGRP